jgi:hypothetical protein
VEDAVRAQFVFCLAIFALAAVAGAQSPPDYPMWCHGQQGMATSDGKNLIVTFKAGTQSAKTSLDPGVCSWLDRGFRPGEPTKIIDVRPTPGEARITASHINDGMDWTFWVYNAGNYMKARASYKGKVTKKPQNID